MSRQIIVGCGRLSWRGCRGSWLLSVQALASPKRQTGGAGPLFLYTRTVLAYSIPITTATKYHNRSCYAKEPGFQKKKGSAIAS